MICGSLRSLRHAISFLACAVTSITCFPSVGSPDYFEVTTGRDAEDESVGDGRCTSTLPGAPCTLRAALQESNASPDENTVRLGRRTHILTVPEFLHVTEDVRLRGSGTRESVIDGIDDGRDQPLFLVDGALVWLTDLTIRNGGEVQRGGAIRIGNGGSASLARVEISNNDAFTGGGGIYVQDGSLILIDSSVSNNRAIGAFAGGIYVHGTGRLTIDRSTIDGNESNRSGGIYNFGSATITNSTISGNSARSDRRGSGGIINVGTAHLNNVTIYGNSSEAPFDEPQSSGGLATGSGARTTVSNTILAHNTRGASANDCTGPVTSYGYNLIEDADDCVLSDILTGNITGRDPQLSPLAYNLGAATRTHLPMSSSPVISAGHPQVGPGVSTRGRCERRDQTGWVRQLTGSGERCEIGSIEVR